MPQLTDEEIGKYWEIFSSQNPVGGVLSGEKMLTLLKNSQLDHAKLEKIWDLADMDGDGAMDFEEFCIAMRLVFDVLHGNMPSVPADLPDWLIPASKKHLLVAKQALATNSTGTESLGLGPQPADVDDMGLSSDFNWYISPGDRRNYENIYSANCDRAGCVAFDSLSELYSTLDIPETDISSAWNLVNPKSQESINKDQCIVFLHILNNRSAGKRVPRSVPASLRATFERNEPTYDVTDRQGEVRRPPQVQSTSFGAKEKFAENYLSRLGLGGRSQGYVSSGTDFSQSNDSDWEEVRLKRELNDLEKTIAKIERERDERKKSGNNTSLVRRELQLLLEYKEAQLNAPRKDAADGSLREIKDEIDLMSEQVEDLKQHARAREEQLEQLKQEVSRY